MSDLTRGDDGTGYACDDPRYAGAIELLRRLADSGTGYGVDTSDLNPRPLQDVLDALAASQKQVRELASAALAVTNSRSIDEELRQNLNRLATLSEAALMAGPADLRPTPEPPPVPPDQGV